MNWLMWILKLAFQVIPILLGIDWRRPRTGESILPHKKYRKRNYFLD